MTRFPIATRLLDLRTAARLSQAEVADGAWNVIVNDDSGQSADGAATVTP